MRSVNPHPTWERYRWIEFPCLRCNGFSQLIVLLGISRLILKGLRRVQHWPWDRGLNKVWGNKV